MGAMEEGKEGMICGGVGVVSRLFPRPNHQNDIGGYRGRRLHTFWLTGAFHGTWLGGRHCLPIADYQWHTSCLSSPGSVRVLCEEMFGGDGIRVLEKIGRMFRGGLSGCSQNRC